MEYSCLSIIDPSYYGTIHSLQRCSECAAVYCTCFEKLAMCVICDNIYCSDCISSKKLLLTSNFCECKLCRNCSFTDSILLSEHGNICSVYRNKIKILLHSHEKLRVDIIDYLSEFLWC